MNVSLSKTNAPSPKLSSEKALDPPEINTTTAPPAGSALYVEKVRLINELQRDQKSLKAQVLVAVSKAKRAAEREDFLLQEIARVNEALKCVRLDPVDEAKRLKARLAALHEKSTGAAIDFWADSNRSHTLALLQDRVDEVTVFAARCGSALAFLSNAMFPRNPQPEGLPALMKVFKDGGEIHKFVRVQLVAGAKVALSWVLVHHPSLDLDFVAWNRPGPTINMEPFYATARSSAIKIIRQMLDQDVQFFY